MKRLLTSCFGLGFLPIAPGTWGSIPPVVIFLIMRLSDLSSPAIFITLFLLGAMFSAACLLFSKNVIKKTGKKDPSEVVADEFAGQAVTLLFACFITEVNLYALCLAAFLLFRFFDIAKTWPACKFESLPGGLGILADDLMAGIYGGVILVIISSFV